MIKMCCFFLNNRSINTVTVTFKNDTIYIYIYIFFFGGGGGVYTYCNQSHFTTQYIPFHHAFSLHYRPMYDAETY